MLTAREQEIAILLACLDDVYWFSIPEFETFIQKTIHKDIEFATEIKKHLMFGQSIKRWDELEKNPKEKTKE